MYDLIGDIHGHADELKLLLRKLGYSKGADAWYHSERKVVFVGDFIDRGPAIRETLHLVRSMVENGSAVAVMGNHEYNALAFHQPHPNGGHIRPHTIKNIVQHHKTLLQFKNRQREYEDFLDWFMKLPLFLEFADFNVVHACWDISHIGFLKTVLNENRLTSETLYAAATKGSPLYEAIEDTLKGREIAMPEGLSFEDKDGIIRNEIRIRWWQQLEQSTYRNYSIQELPQLPELAVKNKVIPHYPSFEKPVFFGHYWLQGEPFLFRENVCCLDYSVAKHGRLVAYRWDGRRELRPENFTYVDCQSN